MWLNDKDYWSTFFNIVTYSLSIMCSSIFFRRRPLKKIHRGYWHCCIWRILLLRIAHDFKLIIFKKSSVVVSDYLWHLKQICQQAIMKHRYFSKWVPRSCRICVRHLHLNDTYQYVPNTPKSLLDLKNLNSCNLELCSL